MYRPSGRVLSDDVLSDDVLSDEGASTFRSCPFGRLRTTTITNPSMYVKPNPRPCLLTTFIASACTSAESISAWLWTTSACVPTAADCAIQDKAQSKLKALAGRPDCRHSRRRQDKICCFWLHSASRPRHLFSNLGHVQCNRSFLQEETQHVDPDAACVAKLSA